jgi:hypothetical protein
VITSALAAVPSEVWPTKGTAGTAYCAAALAVCAIPDSKKRPRAETGPRRQGGQSLSEPFKSAALAPSAPLADSVLLGRNRNDVGHLAPPALSAASVFSSRIAPASSSPARSGGVLNCLNPCASVQVSAPIVAATAVASGKPAIS